MQTRLSSLLEASLNTFTGFVISYAAGLIIYPSFGFNPSPSQNALIVALFTVVSVVRSYAWRRLFNRIAHRTTAQ